MILLPQWNGRLSADAAPTSSCAAATISAPRIAPLVRINCLLAPCGRRAITTVRRRSGRWLQHDDGYLAPFRGALVVVIRRVDLLQLRPELRTLVGSRGARLRAVGLLADLDVAHRVRDEILVPVRVIRRAALRRDDHVRRAMLAVDERGGDIASGLPPLHGQEQGGSHWLAAAERGIEEVRL